MTDRGAGKACWLQVSSGRGPAECQIAAALLTRELSRAGKAAGVEIEIVDALPGEGRDRLLSALVKIEGEAASTFARGYAGTVQWICPSPLRPHHKRKNWFVTVDLLDAAKDRPTALDPGDVNFETMRASGAGGQHVNKTESAVRATHRPSGLVVVAREERSQHMNKRLALARIAARLAEMEAGKAAERREQRWAAHDRLERGGAVRTFTGPAFREKG